MIAPREPALPGPQTRIAPASWRCIDFISDLHLAHDTPCTFAVWAAYLRDTAADAVFILGDLFEVWVGDDAREGEFEGRCAAVLAEASSRISVGHMVGNRDFLVGEALLTACSVDPLSDPTLLEAFGQRVLLSHGDALCLDDVEYQRFRQQVRNPAWQREFLAQPLAQRQAVARQMRAASEARKDAAEPWVDLDLEATRGLLHKAGASILIHGHTHRPADEDLGPGHRRIVLSDWNLDDPSHATRAEVLRWQAGGFTRLTPEDASTRPHRT